LQQDLITSARAAQRAKLARRARLGHRAPRTLCAAGAPSTPNVQLRVLAINLDEQAVPAQAFDELYHQRWRIAEAFKGPQASSAGGGRQAWLSRLCSSVTLKSGGLPPAPAIATAFKKQPDASIRCVWLPITLGSGNCANPAEEARGHAGHQDFTAFVKRLQCPTLPRVFTPVFLMLVNYPDTWRKVVVPTHTGVVSRWVVLDLAVRQDFVLGKNFPKDAVNARRARAEKDRALARARARARSISWRRERT